MEIKVSKSWRKKLGLADGDVLDVKSSVDAFEEKGAVDFNQPLPRTHMATLSTPAVDLDDEVVLPKGIDFTVFKKNPLAYFGHAWRGFPIGNWKDWVVSHSGLKATLDIVPRPNDKPKEQSWEADDVNYLVHRKVLRGVSIGFKRLEQSRPEPKEIEKNPEWSRARTILRSCLLLEASVVPMPCNHEAWLKEVSQGSVSKSMLEVLDAPDTLSLKEAHWKAAHAHLLGELSNEELDKQEDVDEIKYILSILGLHGFTRDLVLAPKQVEVLGLKVSDLEGQLKAAKEAKAPEGPTPEQLRAQAAQDMADRIKLVSTAVSITLDKVFDMVDNTLAQVTGRVTK